MIEGRGQTAFTLKTLAVDVAPALGREHLERHSPAGLDFLGFVDHAHPALAKQCHGAIRAEDAAWRQRVWPAIRRVGAFARLIGQGQRFEAEPIVRRRVGTLLRPRRFDCVSHGRIDARRLMWTVARKPVG